MILYGTQSWVELVFRFHGTVWRQIWWKVVLITFYTCLSYVFCTYTQMDLGHMKGNVLGSTVSFLLVFRANNAYGRYWQGRTLLTHYFSLLREIIAFGCTFLVGGARCKKWLWRNRDMPTEDELKAATTSTTTSSASCAPTSAAGGWSWRCRCRCTRASWRRWSTAT